ncbi:MAG TPA: hypothetical protein DCS93_21260 [Microscillaceae bacterium]|nr:hypothetical protein [Microscillaceae bacterium]
MGFMMIHNALPHTHHEHPPTTQQEAHNHYHHSSDQAHHHHHDTETEASASLLLNLFLNTHVHFPHTSEHPVITSESSLVVKQKVKPTVGIYSPLTHKYAVKYFFQSQEDIQPETFPVRVLLQSHTLRGPPCKFSS